jgi:BetI-type transcriptional repressor, C-terminal
MLGRGRDREFEAERLHALIDGLSVQTMYDRSMMPPKAIRRIVRAHLADMGRAATAAH